MKLNIKHQMKLFKNILILAFVLLTSSLTTAQEYDIHFVHGSWKEVLQMAKKQNKPIFVDCYTTWCGPCKILAKEVFTQKEVADFFNQNFVCVSLDMEKGEAIKLKKDWKLKAFPTLMFLDSKGNENHRIVGAFGATEFLEYSKMGLDENKMSARLQKRYEAGERGGQFIFDYLVSVRLSFNGELEAKVADDFVKSIPRNELLKKENWNVVKNFMNDPTTEEYRFIIANRTALAQAVGSAEEVNAKINRNIEKQLETWTFWNEEKPFETDKETQLIQFLQESDYEGAPVLIGKLLANKYKRVKDSEQYLSLLDYLVRLNLVENSGTIVRYANEVSNSYTSPQAWAKALVWLNIAEKKETQIEHKAVILTAKSDLLTKLGNKSEAELAKLAAEKADKESEETGKKIHTVPMMLMTGQKPKK